MAFKGSWVRIPSAPQIGEIGNWEIRELGNQGIRKLGKRVQIVEPFFYNLSWEL